MVRICVDDEGVSYAVFDEKLGAYEKGELIKNAKGVVVEGKIVITRSVISDGIKCFHAYIDGGLRVEKKGLLVILRAGTT